MVVPGIDADSPVADRIYPITARSIRHPDHDHLGYADGHAQLDVPVTDEYRYGDGKRERVVDVIRIGPNSVGRTLGVSVVG